MPVQINEVIVRTVVDSRPPNNQQESAPRDTTTDATKGMSKEELLERVLEIIEQSKER